MLNAEPQPERKKMTDLELSMGRTHPNDFINLFLVTKRVVLGTTLYKWSQLNLVIRLILNIWERHENPFSLGSKFDCGPQIAMVLSPAGLISNMSLKCGIV